MFLECSNFIVVEISFLVLQKIQEMKYEIPKTLFAKNEMFIDNVTRYTIEVDYYEATKTINK